VLKTTGMLLKEAVRVIKCPFSAITSTGLRSRSRTTRPSLTTPPPNTGRATVSGRSNRGLPGGPPARVGPADRIGMNAPGEFIVPVHMPGTVMQIPATVAGLRGS
jgi:hypothetical protein